ncbi:hypothetical protein KNV66_gp05 [Bacillus phage DLc1]|uniref:Uncharacterized protein n=1 Tax=Bacillus phage DLc1 TaxID=2777318 RepID=A0A7M1RPT5_9CAUD|nr:hypothetical protein KNV66_gp05 [Bacillus phage DLc1]QOR56298.1 hypothetical protein [Bacillus phage DLc1]
MKDYNTELFEQEMKNQTLQGMTWQPQNNNSQQYSNIKYLELKEQQAMRRAYCKVNDIPYEEVNIEIPSMKQNLSSGLLKVTVVIVYLFIIGTIISALIGEGNFLTNFMKAWF